MYLYTHPGPQLTCHAWCLPTWPPDRFCLFHRCLFARSPLSSNRIFPIVGDILLGVWKANSRNAALLEEYLRIRGEEFLKGGKQGTGKRASRLSNLYVRLVGDGTLSPTFPVDQSVVKPGDGRVPGEKVTKVASTSVGYHLFLISR